MTEREPPRQIGADEPSPEALARYVADESSPQEAESLAAWLATHPETGAVMGTLRAGTSALTRAVPPVDVEAALATVRARIAHEERVRPIRRMRWTTAISLAAAAALAIVWLGSTWRPRVSEWWADLFDSSTHRVQTYATTGGTFTVKLADGTRVLLGPHSTLAVRGDYGVRNRAVRLNGFGRFEVRHDADLPFVVTDGAAVIQDVGTTFVVRDGDDSSVVVAVTSGQVRLSRADGDRGTLDLRAGERGVARPNERPAQADAALAPDDTSWMSGRLTFDDVPLALAVPRLERWYGVQIRLTDSTLGARRLTGTFESADPVDRVLSTIALALDARFGRVADTVVISSKPSP